MQELLTVKEVCERLRMSRMSIYALIDAEELRGFRVGPKGKLRRVDAESVEEFLRARETRKRTVRPAPRHDLAKHAQLAIQAIYQKYKNL